jgi:DNA-binding NarL/FixJ family response regulator
MALTSSDSSRADAPFAPSLRDSAQNWVSSLDQTLSSSLPSLALYVDARSLSRECFSERLAYHLPEWSIEPASSVRELQCNGNWPRASVVILNTHSASVNSPEVAEDIALIAAAAPNTPLVLLSDLDEPMEVIRAIHLGARGYLSTNSSIQQAIGVIRLVEQGGTYIPLSILTACEGADHTSSRRPLTEKQTSVGFSPRQLQVLKALRQGKQNKIIAYELGMCESTVKVHIRHIMKKLNARNRTQVVSMTNALEPDLPK